MKFTCRLCGSEKFSLFKRFGSGVSTIEIKASGSSPLSTNLVKCERCLLITQFPEHDKDYVESLYASESDEEFVYHNNARVSTFSKSIKNLLKLNYISVSDRGLDVGCAGGAFPYASKINSISVEGVEPSLYLSNYARENYGLKIHTGFLTDIHNQFSSDSFDFVTLWDVIEHVYDLNDTMQIIKRILKGDGVLILNVPDVNSMPARVMGKYWPMYLDVHLHYFNKENITNLCEKFGFKLVYTNNYYQELELGYILSRGLQHLFNMRLPKIIQKILSLKVSYYIGQKTYVFKSVNNI